jgi:hypothetical protein
MNAEESNEHVIILTPDNVKIVDDWLWKTVLSLYIKGVREFDPPSIGLESAFIILKHKGFSISKRTARDSFHEEYGTLNVPKIIFGEV